MKSNNLDEKPPENVRPREYVRLKGWPLTTYFKVVADGSGIKLKRARLLESWGALLGANMAYRFDNGAKIRVLGLDFILHGDAQGEGCSLTEVSEEI